MFNLKNMDLKNKNSIVIVALAFICLILAGALIYFYFQIEQKAGKISEKIGENKEEENIISSEEASKLALAYINESILKGQAKIEFIGEPKEESGLYKLQGKMGGQEFFVYISKDGKLFFPQGFNIEEATSSVGKTGNEKTSESVVLGNFLETKDEVCKEQGKPIVYFFGSVRCPHCVWEKPIIEKVAENFKEYISFHKNIDSSDDQKIFSKYSQGGVPTLVLGCKYYREGSGERDGEENETKNLTALICKLTNSQPKEVCAAVKDLIEK